MPAQPQFPWMFHRDEVDLLEEDLDQIYDTFADRSQQEVSMEDMLIQEQLETEEASQEEWMLHASSSWFLPGSADKTKQNHVSREDSTPSIKESLAYSVQRPHIYEHVYAWAQTVFGIGKELYQSNLVSSEDAFCVYLNAKLIPIKLASAIMEESHTDPISREMALKEYDLTLVYLDRVLGSLLRITDELPNSALHPLLKKGLELQRTLEVYVKKFRRGDYSGS